jgi:hypothetical protein
MVLISNENRLISVGIDKIPGGLFICELSNEVARIVLAVDSITIIQTAESIIKKPSMNDVHSA